LYMVGLKRQRTSIPRMWIRLSPVLTFVFKFRAFRLLTTVDLLTRLRPSNTAVFITIFRKINQHTSRRDLIIFAAVMELTSDLSISGINSTTSIPIILRVERKLMNLSIN